MRPFTLISILALLAMSIWHAVSLVQGWPLLVGEWLVPLWIRWVLLAFTGSLAVLLWRESFSFRVLMGK